MKYGNFLTNIKKSDYFYIIEFRKMITRLYIQIYSFFATRQSMGRIAWGRVHIKTLSYQYKDSYYQDKTVPWLPYLMIGIPIHRKTAFILNQDLDVYKYLIWYHKCYDSFRKDSAEESHDDWSAARQRRQQWLGERLQYLSFSNGDSTVSPRHQYELWCQKEGVFIYRSLS